MPPVSYQDLHKRTDPGTTFSVIFGVIAGSVVAACAIWGFVIPKWRKSHPPNPTRTKWNDGSILTRKRPRRSRTTFPSHPAVKPLLSKPSAAQILPTYNPRVESPFPDGPEPGICKTFSSVVSRSNSAPVAPPSISSNGLFTPIRHGTPIEDDSDDRFHTVPRAVDAKHFAGKSTDFGDARDFILAVPEPLALRPRDAGRPPAVARHLEKYGKPQTASPAGSDKLPHPNKLFRAVQTGTVRSSLCSSTSLRLDHRESDAADTAAKEVAYAVDKAIMEEAENRQHRLHSSDGSSKSARLVNKTHGSSAPNESSTALHRLRSYRSLTSSKVPTLARSGTLTRPKTPVDELRRIYGQDSAGLTVPMVSLPKDMTTSTMMTAFENSSENESVSTPATSPTLPPSSLKLLPTPLRPYKSNDRIMQSSSLGPTLDDMYTPAVEEDANAMSRSQTSKLKYEKGIYRKLHYTGRRSKPAPLDLSRSDRLSPCQRQQPRRSLSELVNSVSPIKSSHLKPKFRASSMYSRDTYGRSLESTPATSTFPTSVTDIFADHGVSANPFIGHESVKARISEWTQRIEGLPTPPLPCSKAVSPGLAPASAGLEFKKCSIDENERSKQHNVLESSTDCQESSEDSRLNSFDPLPGGAIWI